MNRTESGAVSLTALVLGLLLAAALGFGGWAFQGMQHYKNDSDQISKQAVAKAVAAQKTQLTDQFNQELKNPYKTFTGSATYGSITFKYPNTWSSYVDTTSSDEPINGYFNPGDVPGTNSNSAFALRVELTNKQYNDVVKSYSDQTKKISIIANTYVPPMLQNTANVQRGTLLKGIISSSDNAPLNGEMLIIPVRDKTLQVYTLSNDYLDDFNNVVLANLSFIP